MTRPAAARILTPVVLKTALRKTLPLGDMLQLCYDSLTCHFSPTQNSHQHSRYVACYSYVMTV
jgi:hypothetical protein